MISKDLEKTLNFAVQVAHDARHEFVTTEHLLLALLDNASAMAVLQACGADIDALRENLSQHLADNVPQIDGETDLKTQPTVGFQRVFAAGNCACAKCQQTRSRRRKPDCRNFF